MSSVNQFDVIIVGGSYAGLASGMALGRSLRRVLIIDDEKPCNAQTPYSHNFITNDGLPPGKIAEIAKKQVSLYNTVIFFKGRAISGSQTESGFVIKTDHGNEFTSTKLIFATGIKDLMPDIKGFAECWGISVLHCPYCHGYEVRNQRTGILGNGVYGFEFSGLISNWTKDLTLFTNGISMLTEEQERILLQHNIRIIEDEIEKLDHKNGYLQQIIFKSSPRIPITAIYARTLFEQSSSIPASLGCVLNNDGYIQVDTSQKTTTPGVFACGDNSSRLRTVANAVATGTTAGMMANRELVDEEFLTTVRF